MPDWPARLPDLPALLAARLAAYSAAAGVALAVAPAASAQVVYHDLDPDGEIENTSGQPGFEVWYDLDVDDDGVADLRVFGYYYDWRTVDLRRAPGGETANGFLACEDYCYFQQENIALRLSGGDVIGPQTKPYVTFIPRAIAAGVFFDATATSSDETVGYFLGREGYAGFRFIGGDGALRYGWLRLAVDERAEVTTIYEYAYESAPETPIVAGAQSVARLEGSVSPTTFPPSGGTLRYTFAVTNTTDEPQPLDLWFDAAGPASFTRWLGSGTLAAGTTVTRTVQVRVPMGIPAGTYDVRFKLGDFASAQFITFERFSVTKAVGISAEGEAAFGVWEGPGDLFASGHVPADGTGAHALSAPTPNPSAGEVSVTLVVAEAQAVRVEVLDALGRRVAVLHDGPTAPGTPHRLVFDGASLPAGVYAVRAVGDTFSETRVVTLTR